MFSQFHLLVGCYTLFFFNLWYMKIFLYFCGKNTDNCHKINHTKNPEVAKQKAYEETKYSSEADCLGMKA